MPFFHLNIWGILLLISQKTTQNVHIFLIFKHLDRNGCKSIKYSISIFDHNNLTIRYLYRFRSGII
jgi:hypothetical protein